jgi:integrase
LRHTFASVAAAEGKSLLMIGKLLGHTQEQTTRRYAHLAGGTVKAAANDIADVIANSMLAAGAPSYPSA